ncbi:MAG: tripartite tricarboxylate transporter substrate binding protein [Burkholderiaceae bacterium]
MTLRSRLLLLTLAILAPPVLAADPPYPDNKPIRLIVPAAPGGGADFVARILGQKLGESLGQTVVVDNRAGASGTIAADNTAKAAPDGHTLLIGQSTSIVIAPHMYAKLGYDTLRDLAPITLVAQVPNILVVHPSVKAANVKELIALAKARPDLLNYGSSGNGAPSHLAGEMFKSAAGVTMTHVPYKGAGPAVNDLVAGQIQIMFAPIVAVLPQVKAGRLRALAVTSAARSAAAAEVPTLAESGLPGYEISSWFGLFAPSGTPPAVIERLYKESAKALQSADVRERFAHEGAEPGGNPPAEFSGYVKGEFAKFGRIVKGIGIKAE